MTELIGLWLLSGTVTCVWIVWRMESFVDQISILAKRAKKDPSELQNAVADLFALLNNILSFIYIAAITGPLGLLTVVSFEVGLVYIAIFIKIKSIRGK